jgi:hypothetical protein
MLKRILDWLIGRREPKTERLDEIERRLYALSLRVSVRTRGRS